MTKLWIHPCETETEFWRIALDDAIFCIQETLKKHEDCRLGLAGGSTPKALYEKLAEADLPWERIKVIQLDERYVPSDDKESNLGMLRKSLFARVAIPPENIFAFDTSLPYASAAEEMNRRLSQLQAANRPLLDCLILGAGADGHIASLFEDDAALQSTELAAEANAKGYPTPRRLTLTLNALKQASSALLLLKGPEKTPVIEALEGRTDQPPLTALKTLLPTVTLKVLAYLQN